METVRKTDILDEASRKCVEDGPKNWVVFQKVEFVRLEGIQKAQPDE
jgi:hypothetical protein